MDDNGDYRPGLQAVAELGIKSPLRASKLNKADIRALSKDLGLPTWNKQSFACLSSRFVYGETISEENQDSLKSLETIKDILEEDEEEISPEMKELGEYIMNHQA